jgi:hypothetical protein
MFHAYIRYFRPDDNAADAFVVDHNNSEIFSLVQPSIKPDGTCNAALYDTWVDDCRDEIEDRATVLCGEESTTLVEYEVYQIIT